ncbi:transporter substrate-binding domain-containing protein [Pontibacter sp. MBLB2868]|uniref:transporter substrate-binding domain-containing protein n=1 Tax=Pontibacter sp. MBLB2868 TaxID=3451555 RepID=UPI003F753021
MKYTFILVVCLALCAGCGNFPKDTENTLKQVSNGTLIVGYSENPPWVIKNDSIPTGVEPELVKGFAKTINAKIEWKNDTEHNLYELLEKKEVHLVIAGITRDNPWKTRVAFTRPYAEQDYEKHVMASIKGENAFIIKLEKYLFEKEGEVKKMLTDGEDK